jgi:hypothetical protein
LSERTTSGAAGEHIAHLIDLDRAARRLAPGAEQFAPLLVEVGERQALATTLGRRADLGHFHERVPQPLSVHANV